MRNSIILLALTALSISVSGLALPANTVLATQTCQFQELRKNQSTVFGWQLAGAAIDTAESKAACSSLPNAKLANAGLDVQSIKAPSCKATTAEATTAEVNATSALPMVVEYSSSAFTTMLINAFPSDREASFRYLCDNIRFRQLSAFMLNDATIINATCNKGGPDAKISPQPFTSIAEPNKTAIAAYRDISSKLFAQNYAATASSPQELKQRCNSAPDHASNLKALELDPASVSLELCSIQTPPQAPETEAAIKDLSSQQFVTVVENISNVPGWKKWLCNELDADAMNAAGLDGAKVVSQICESAEEGDYSAGQQQQGEN